MITLGNYGYKINNYEAGSIYEVDCGVRKKYDTKPAMLTNSLFLDFLKANGLTTKNDKFTRDIICLNFNYGSRTYDNEMARIDVALAESPDNEYLKALKAECEANKDKFDCKSADEIRPLHERIRRSDYRQQYHIQSVTGLLNDPNGFVLHDGLWHLFY